MSNRTVDECFNCRIVNEGRRLSNGFMCDSCLNKLERVFTVVAVGIGDNQDEDDVNVDPF